MHAGGHHSAQFHLHAALTSHTLARPSAFCALHRLLDGGVEPFHGRRGVVVEPKWLRMIRYEVYVMLILSHVKILHSLYHLVTARLFRSCFRRLMKINVSPVPGPQNIFDKFWIASGKLVEVSSHWDIGQLFPHTRGCSFALFANSRELGLCCPVRVPPKCRVFTHTT